MDHTAGGTVMFRFHNVQFVLRRVTAVDDHRESRLFCYLKLAEIKCVSKEEIIRETTKNARALYRITE